MWGGVALYVGEHLHAVRRLDFESNANELLWAEIKVDCFKLLCGVCYRPPNQSAESIDEFFTCFQESLDLIFSTSEFSAVFILGDFNAHFSFNETSAPNTDIGLNLLIFCGLCNKTLNLFHGANFNYLGFVAFAKAYNCHLHPTVFVC